MINISFDACLMQGGELFHHLEREDQTDMTTISTKFLMQLQRNPQHIVFKVRNSTGHIESCERGDLLKTISGFTQRFYALGVTQGTRVGVLADCSIEVASVVMAILSLGAVVVPIPLSVRSSLKRSDCGLTKSLINKNCSSVIVSQDQDALRLEQLLDEEFEPIQVFSLEGENEDVLPLLPAEVEPEFYQRTVFLNDADSAAFVLWDESDQVLNHQTLIDAHITHRSQSFSHGDCVWASADMMYQLGMELLVGALIGDHTLCFSSDTKSRLKFRPSVVLMSSRELSLLYLGFLEEQGDLLAMLCRWAFVVAVKADRNRSGGLTSKRIEIQERLLETVFKRMRDHIFEGVQWIGLLDEADTEMISWLNGINMSTSVCSRILSEAHLH